MTASYVQVPSDSTGKKLNTRQRTVGANTVEDQYMIPISERVTTGVYYFQTGVHTVLAAAQTGTTNFWAIFNTGTTTGSPTGGAQLLAIRGIDFRSQHGSALATPTSPRLTLSRCTYTSTIAGTAVTGAKRDSTDATSIADCRLAATATGLTVVANVISWFPIAAITAVGTSAPGESDWEPSEVGQFVIRPGEAVILQQLDAGTTSDTRRFLTTIRVESFYLP